MSRGEGRGRTSKRTPETMKRLGDALAMGLSYKHACAYADIDESTFYRWMQDDRNFSGYIRAQEGKTALALMTRMQRESREGDWHATAWLLEHRWPEEYAKTRIEIEHSGHVDITILAGIRAVIEQVLVDQPETVVAISEALAQLQPPDEQDTPSKKKKTERAS